MNLREARKILIFAPHPCDEIMGCSGVIKAAIKQQIPYRIVITTQGDADFWGRIIHWCRNNLVEYHRLPTDNEVQQVIDEAADAVANPPTSDELYVEGATLRIGATKYTSQGNNGLRVQAIVYVEANNGLPVPGYKLVVLNENLPKVFYTNDLGWAVTDISPANLFPVIAGVGGIEFVLKRKFNPMDDDGYGATRVQESIEALQELGVTPEHIVSWQFKDGTLFKLNEIHPEIYASFVRNIREQLMEFADGSVFIPHPEDADPDHRALAQIVLMFKDKFPEMTCYKYLINLTENHRRWPLPAYQNSHLDRLAPAFEIETPEKFHSAEVVSLALEEVGLDSWTKLQLLQKFRTQIAVDETGFRYSMAKRNELYFK